MQKEVVIMPINREVTCGSTIPSPRRNYGSFPNSRRVSTKLTGTRTQKIGIS